MKWEKLGRIFEPQNVCADLMSHAANPIAVPLIDNVIRVFYNGRNAENKSSVGYFDFDMHAFALTDVALSAIITYGPDSSFYSAGISIGSTYNVAFQDYILFMGWKLLRNGQWRGEIGRLKLSNYSALNLDPEQVLVGLDAIDPISLSYPWVILDEGVYKMWYGSTISWISSNREMIHVIKYAESKDGVNWEKFGQAIPHELGIAQAFSRPSVIRDTDGYHMWYSYRPGAGASYRIGYSFSSNGRDWKRKHEEVGICVSETGWDREMICYPFVFNFKNDRYMLFNGNGNGQTGIGLAKLVVE